MAVLKVVVGHICQNIGWNSLQQSSLNILVDLLHRYLLELCKCTHGYMNDASRTEANTDDVLLAFRDFGLKEKALLDFLLNVDTLAFPHKLPIYPVGQGAMLCFPKTVDPNRPGWIDSHLPSLRPEMEIEEGFNLDQQVVPTSPQVHDNGVKRAEDGSLKITINKKLKVSDIVL